MTHIWKTLTAAIGLTAGLIFNAGATTLVDEEFRMLGLAVHQETGRNIYLAAIHFPQEVPWPEDLVQAAGPKLMEYRIVTRRTSIRSLLGGVLLQSEVATGDSPDDETVGFANRIMGAVRGSLYAGDSFQILLTEDDQTIARLNGQELARIDNGYVADYFLMGWVGETGPTTAFRTRLLAGGADAQLSSIYMANVASDERMAAVAGWTEPKSEVMVAVTEQVPAEIPPTEPELSPVIEPEAEADTSAAAAIAAAGAAALAAEVEPEIIAQAEPAPTLDVAAEPDADAVQVASLIPAVPVVIEEEAEIDVLADIDVMEYSQRLAAFNTQLFRLVNGKVRYPKAAIRRDLEGSLELDVVLQDDGSLVGVSVAASSGSSLLDDAALRAANRAFKDSDLGQVDPVVKAEYSDENDNLVIPVPVKFVLSQ